MLLEKLDGGLMRNLNLFKTVQVVAPFDKHYNFQYTMDYETG